MFLGFVGSMAVVRRETTSGEGRGTRGEERLSGCGFGLGHGLLVFLGFVQDYRGCAPLLHNVRGEGRGTRDEKKRLGSGFDLVHGLLVFLGFVRSVAAVRRSYRQ